jgi:NAD(P)-dependent dehydrogenase (short-subunit alcohol dehydrogenase family)
VSDVRNIAVVTGGASGIGVEIGRQMLTAGYDVVVLDRQRPRQACERVTAVEIDLLDASARASAR